MSQDLREAGRMLRALAVALPGRNASERATARRVEGASAVLAVLAERRP